MISSLYLNLNPSPNHLVTTDRLDPHQNQRPFIPHYPAFSCTVPIIKSSKTIITSSFSKRIHPLILTSFRTQCTTTTSLTVYDDETNHYLKPEQVKEETQEKSFWAASSLIIGTAVGPGMLGLPSATIRSGPLPSTITIVLSWVYVISSILLVAELSFAAMEEDGVDEVSFTSLATKAFGGRFGAYVAVVYACLSFSLLVACVSGIGSIFSQWFPWMNPIVAHAIFPCISGFIIGFFPFKAIDAANRFLCITMILSITALVGVGLSVGRSKILGSLGYASWAPSAVLPAIPLTVLTLGFHVITPFICKIAGKTLFDARRAILFGGAVPLFMVLSWNLVILGLARATTACSEDPIGLILSINASALPAVQGFAFSALATSLIGYAVSFPKQLVDAIELISGREKSTNVGFNDGGNGRVGFALYWKGKRFGTLGQVSFAASRCNSGSTAEKTSVNRGSSSANIPVMLLVLGVPVFIASFFRSAFSKALDFAGVYANCFLFGILPPVMAWIYRSRKNFRSSSSGDANILPGGDAALLLLFGIAVTLGLWH
ncbi:tyrosine-specific transport protein-like [Macadamia integrifolia]|uniref:tyrosine-specific transport protein-like n=1 Tax=Macadamia integrifolia TaxID=60698 RepID=UPI001C4E572D|nr:tyrosine-specific transport protein-like [Macadamia integrifolia]XP_042517138.1 tyrosine-specific transport protein-like [Macadamia integrifolia]XP_042517139.1 tyrosine-specific transport protein-like [Macadamia integrifolia]